MAKILSRAVEHYADSIEFADAHLRAEKNLTPEQRALSEAHRDMLFQRTVDAFKRAGRVLMQSDANEAFAIVTQRRAERAQRFENLRREKERLGYR